MLKLSDAASVSRLKPDTADDESFEFEVSDIDGLRPVLAPAAVLRDRVRQQAAASMSRVFPVEATNYRLELADVAVKPASFSLKEVDAAIVQRTSLTEPITGRLVLKDSAGKVLQTDARPRVLGHLPYITEQHTAVLDGNVYAMSNQLRVKPGVYTRVRNNGALESSFNLGKGANFRLYMDPARGVFFLQYNTTRIPLYPILAEMGVPESKLKEAWGADLLRVNQQEVRGKTALAVSKLYAKLVPERLRVPNADVRTMMAAISATYANTVLDPEVTNLTLGAALGKVDANALLLASKKLLRVYRGEEVEDDRDSLAFKTFHTLDTMVRERIEKGAARTLITTVKGKLNRTAKPTISGVLPPSAFSGPLKSLFTQNQLAQMPSQINPVELLDSAVKVTSLGEGGISSLRSVPDSTRGQHFSHLGLLDTIRTPESSGVGVDLRAAAHMQVDRRGNMYAPMYEVKNGKRGAIRMVSAQEMVQAVIAFEDADLSKARVPALRAGMVRDVPVKEVQFQVPTTNVKHSPAALLVPGKGAAQGNRLIMGSKQQTQAVPLLKREAPLLQVDRGDGTSMESSFASWHLPVSPVDGTVSRIDTEKNRVHIQPTKGGETVEVEYADNFPFASKTRLHHEIDVRVGDKVKAGQRLGDSNFTRGGTLALGTNLRTAYMAYYGLNSNDAVVVSKSAAEEMLVSEHMYRETLDLHEGVKPSSELHKRYFGSRHKPEEYARLDPEGLPKVGSKVGSGELVLAAVGRKMASSDDALLGKLSKSLVQPYADKSIVWQHAHPGEIVRVERGPKAISVLIRTHTPMGVGDKLCLDGATDVLTLRGWVPAPLVTCDDHVAVMVAGELQYARPHGVHHHPHADAMISVVTRDISLHVSSGHRMYASLDRESWALAPAEGLEQIAWYAMKRATWRGTVPDGGPLWTQRAAAATRRAAVLVPHEMPDAATVDALCALPGAEIKLAIKSWLPSVARGRTPEHTALGVYVLRGCSPLEADRLQRMAVHGGVVCDIDETSQGCVLRWSFSRSAAMPRVPVGCTHMAPSREPVWGFTVPGGIMMVRRAGRVCWTGNSGRYGNKGVVSAIVPDDQMPRGEDGRPFHLLLTSAGVVSRINPMQVVERAVSKVARKTGQPVLLEEFPKHSIVEHAKSLLKKHGLKDKESVYDPVSGRTIPGIATGEVYTLKLFKDTESNFSTRGVGRVDVNEQPTRGGLDGAKAVGRMDFYALVAHGATNALRESAAIKGTANHEFWRRMQLGLPEPPVKAPFAFNKFTTLLTGSGINVEKKDSSYSLAPLTDADVLKLAPRAITTAGVITSRSGKDTVQLIPERGGLFDPVITGGVKGTKWSRIDLVEPVPNPVFDDASKSLLGMTSKQFDDFYESSGGAALRERLNAVDLDARESEITALVNRDLQKGPGGEAAVDKAVKTLKAIRALKSRGLKAGDAYVVQHVPVVPPQMRTVATSGDSTVMVADANFLYKDLMLTDMAIRGMPAELREIEDMGKHRRVLRQAVSAVVGLGDPVNPKTAARSVRGFLQQAAGVRTPKEGFFQAKLIKRNQDLSGRATIAPDPSLGIDEVGVPWDMLWTQYKPMVMRALVMGGHPATRAEQLIAERHPSAKAALLREIKTRPIYINRAPTLHRFNVVAAYPVPVEGKTLYISPFYEQMGNADYDGDAMTTQVPATDAGAREARSLVISRIAMADQTKNTVIAAPQHESVIGAYLATQAPEKGPPQRFKNKAAALDAFRKGQIRINTPIILDDATTRVEEAALRPVTARGSVASQASEGEVAAGGGSRDQQR